MVDSTREGGAGKCGNPIYDVLSVPIYLTQFYIFSGWNTHLYTLGQAVEG
jgi:hypothetical protein